MISLGVDVVISKSKERRINGKTSEDNKTIAVGDFMGSVLNTLLNESTRLQCDTDHHVPGQSKQYETHGEWQEIQQQA